MNVQLKILIMTKATGVQSACCSQDCYRIISMGGKGPLPEKLLVGA